jgi:ATP-binding cassette subfamily B protein
VSRWRRLARVLFTDGFRASPGWMTVVTVLLLLGSVASTSYPIGYRLLVDGALHHDHTRTAVGIGLVAGLLSLGWLLTTVGATEAMALSDRVSLHVSTHLARLTSNAPGIEHFERPDYLTNVEKVVSGRRQIATAPRQTLTNFTTVLRIVTLVVLLATVNLWLLLVPLVAIPPLIASRLARKVRHRVDDELAHRRRLAAALFALTSSAGSAGELRVYGLGPDLTRRHHQLTDETNARSARLAVVEILIEGTGWLMYSCGLMAAVALVVVEASRGHVSPGALLMAVSLIRRSRNQLAQAAAQGGAFAATLDLADRLFWLEDWAESVEPAGRREPPARLTTGISLRGLTFSYPGTDRVVLDSLDLELPAGTTVAVVGENGAGKTTLTKLLLGLYEPDAGRIDVDGTPLADFELTTWRARTTAAFQDAVRLHLTTREAIGIGDVERIDDDRAIHLAIDRGGAGDVLEQLPDGLNTRLGTAFAGRNLSGGQWQKLALGRAMMRDEPLLVVLDEPTASLDATTEHALFERYAAAAQRTSRTTGAVTVLVSHRFSTVMSADLIVVLDGGRIVEQGSHEELVELGGQYAELFELQARSYR